MFFRQLFDRESCTYTYLIADTKTQEAILFDPVIEQFSRDNQLLKELNLKLKFCLETHIHADHITGTGKLREATGCKGIVPDRAAISCADIFISDGEKINLGNIVIQAIETNGHTDSHMAYLVNESLVLTGDALFIRGCGRTDFQSGDAGVLYDSVTQKLFTLPDTTLVYPAHDYKGQTVSTIGEEKQYNPRFNIRVSEEQYKRLDRSNFVNVMNNLNLPNPKKMMEAVPANEQCGNS